MEVRDWSKVERGGVYYLHFFTRAWKWTALRDAPKHTFIVVWVTDQDRAPSRYPAKLGSDTIPKEGNLNCSLFKMFTTSKGRSKIPAFRAAEFVEPKNIQKVAQHWAQQGHMIEVVSD